MQSNLAEDSDGNVAVTGDAESQRVVDGDGDGDVDMQELGRGKRKKKASKNYPTDLFWRH